jgi:hypothetical protein
MKLEHAFEDMERTLIIRHRTGEDAEAKTIFLSCHDAVEESKDFS